MSQNTVSHDVPSIVFGGNVFGWTADEATSFQLLDRCVETGLTAIDTADVYSRLEPGFSGGESETVIGNWLASRGGRENVVIASKFGLEMGEGQVGLSKDYMQRAVDASLARLRTDYIDIYYAHWDDNVTPFEETLAGFADLMASGKIRAIGICNFAPDRLAAALTAGGQGGLPRYQYLQANYNLYDRAEYETAFAPLVEQYDLQGWSYFSLASGFLTGKWSSAEAVAGSRRAMWLERYFTPRGTAILTSLAEVAGDLGATSAQVALAWLRTRPNLAAPIASATSLAQFEDILAASRLNLPEEAIARLDSASA